MGNLRALAIPDATSRANQRRALSISLRALKHPLTLASIGLLLLNDHALKVLMPSPLTGKLSDFAGLFFFPFLLAALLSLPLDRLRVSPRCTAALAFGITLAWFALIKTVPAANALMVEALTRLLGARVQIVLDPTDLLALAALAPAWGLWLRLERAPTPRRLRPADLAALGLAALATVATTDSPALSYVVRLGVSGQDVYAGVRRATDKGSTIRVYYESETWKWGWEGDFQVVRSSDGGRTWAFANRADMDEELVRQLEQPALFPVTVCDPETPQICYRITGAEQVEGSTDGGQTWQVVWQVPEGRRKYMERVVEYNPYKWGELDLTPHDLTLLHQDNATTLIVALGNEGVLVRTPEASWERYEVMNARPTPYAAESSLRALALGLAFALVFPSYETCILATAAALVWLVCCVLGWQVILSRSRRPSQHSVREIIALASLAISPMLMFVVPDRWYRDLLFPLFMVGPFALIIWLMPTVTMIFAFVGPALGWRRVAKLLPQSKLARRAALACFLTALGIFPLAWLPFLLWYSGIIPVYEFALALSVLTGIAVLVCGVYAVRRLSRRAVTPIETTTEVTTS